MQVTKEYQWLPSANGLLKKVDIIKVIKELDEIKEQHGKINPSLVVEKAKDKKSVLHDFFEWDDRAAADAFRRQEASYLLRHIEVKIIKDGEPFFVRAYEVVVSQENNKSPDRIEQNDLTDEDIESLRNILIGDLKGFLKRIKSHEEFEAAAQYIEWAIKVLTPKVQKQPTIEKKVEAA